MFIFLALLFSGVLVAAQLLWRAGINETMQGNFDLGKLTTLLPNLKFVTGGILYVLATIIYFYLQTKYSFSKIQIAIIPAALILSLLGGYLIFENRLSAINLLGIFVICIGVFLAVYKN